MKPVFNQELVPNTQGLWSSFTFLQSTQGTTEASRKVCTSVTVFGLALSLGASGALFSGAEAAEPMRVAYLPSEFDFTNALPSYGSDRPSGAAATYHTVVEGETIWDIAKRYRITIEAIKTANGIIDSQSIQAGQVLKVPSPSIAPEPIVEQPLSGGSMELASAELGPVYAAPYVSTGNLDSENLLTSDENAEASPEDSGVASTQPLPQSGRELSSLRLSAFVESRSEVSEVTQASTKPSVFEGKVSDISVESGSADSPDAVAVLPEVSAEPQIPSRPNLIDEVGRDRSVLRETPKPGEALQPLHQISAGETIWSIAFAHGVTPETLRQANGIANPHVIFPGDTLIIPVESPARSPQLGTGSVDRLGYQEELNYLASDAGQVTTEAVEAEDEIEPKALVEGRILSSTVTDGEIALIEGNVTAEVDLPSADAAIAGAHSFLEQNISQPDSAVESSPLTLAAAPVDFNPTAESDALDVEVDIVDEVEADSVEADADRLVSSEQLLAAAPLGSEVYAPIVESPEGRVVSPDLPALPAQEEYLPEAPNRFNGYMWPAQGILTSGYGWRWGRMHQGVDIAGPVGTPIFAAAPGFVVRSGWNSGGYGNVVDIRHPDGSLTRYAHNSRLLVEEGQEVQQGQQIAEMGSTGYSTGPHLHFEIHLPDQGAVNPMAYLPGQ